MSAVELWKAQQPLLSQWPGPNSSKWRIVGNGENVALDSRPEPRMKISSTVLNRISASSPAPIHRSCHRVSANSSGGRNHVNTKSRRFREEQISYVSRT